MGRAAVVTNIEGATRFKCRRVHRVRSWRNAAANRLIAEKERERLIAELQDALSRVRTLGGLLRICASCKHICDDRGYWSQIETYIQEHLEAEFRHNICPDCFSKLYPDYDPSTPARPE